jgi:hypothetical protein
MFMMRFDMRAPEFGASTAALYADMYVQDWSSSRSGLLDRSDLRSLQ